jgi:hypothetical protein
MEQAAAMQRSEVVTHVDMRTRERMHEAQERAAAARRQEASVKRAEWRFKTTFEPLINKGTYIGG